MLNALEVMNILKKTLLPEKEFAKAARRFSLEVVLPAAKKKTLAYHAPLAVSSIPQPILKHLINAFEATASTSQSAIETKKAGFARNVAVSLRAIFSV